jgi:peptidoglycan hydrolase CwlO-like protein
MLLKEVNVSENVQKRMDELQVELQETEGRMEQMNRQIQELQQAMLELSHKRAGALRAIQELQSLAGLAAPVEVMQP